MNKKGFTLIEMLAVVVILGILLALAVPSITGYLSKGKEEYYNSLEESIKLAAKDYTTEYRQLLPKVIGNVTIIDLSELTDNDYISNIVDSNGNSCNATVTVEKTSKNEYEYYTCLSCEDYKTEDENVKACSFSEDNNVTIYTKDYSFSEIEDNYIVSQGDDTFTLPNVKAYYKKELVNDNVEPSPKTIDTNKLGTTKVVYAYKGLKKEITVTVVDRVSPSIPQITLRKDNSKGNIYNSDNWYSGDIYQEFLSTDYTKEGVLGSGIKKYEISIDKDNYTELTGNYNVSTENGIHTYYIRSIDNNNNISDINTYSLKIDKEIPRCELEVKSGTLGTNGWYTSDVTIGFKSITEEVSSIVYTKITNSNITTNTSGTTAIGVVQDEAGNIGTCKITVKLDKTIPNSPKIYASDNVSNGNWHRKDFNINLSGASNISGNTYYYGTTGNPTTVGTTINISNQTSSLTYYTKVCSGAGKCSNLSSYEVKLDKENPKAEVTVNKKVATFTLTDNMGVVAYGVSNSSGKQPTYTTIGTTTNITVNWEANKAGIYYVWVKDISGRTDFTSFEMAQSAFCSWTINQSQVFEYTGGVQSFSVPCNGTYKLEVWGAQGGYDIEAETNNYQYGGNGGYASGNIQLSREQNLYVAVGGKGEDTNYTSDHANTGGYNGGTGSVYVFENYEGGGGGGATHIALNLNLGELKNYVNNKDAVLIVAGGGGGGSTGPHWYEEGERVKAEYITLSHGGGITASQISYHVKCGNADWEHQRVDYWDSTHSYIQYSDIICNAPNEYRSSDRNAGQTSQLGNDSDFGTGTDYSCGGGWYGGTWRNLYISGSGGSSYIGGVSNGSTQTGVRSGNGYARITLISIAE